MIFFSIVSCTLHRETNSIRRSLNEASKNLNGFSAQIEHKLNSFKEILQNVKHKNPLSKQQPYLSIDKQVYKIEENLQKLKNQEQKVLTLRKSIFSMINGKKQISSNDPEWTSVSKELKEAINIYNKQKDKSQVFNRDFKSLVDMLNQNKISSVTSSEYLSMIDSMKINLETIAREIKNKANYKEISIELQKLVSEINTEKQTVLRKNQNSQTLYFGPGKPSKVVDRYNHFINQLQNNKAN